MRSKNAFVVSQCILENGLIRDKLLDLDWSVTEDYIGFENMCLAWRTTPKIRGRPSLICEDQLAKSDLFVVGADGILEVDFDLLGVIFAARQVFPKLPITVLAVNERKRDSVLWFNSHLARVGIQPCRSLEHFTVSNDTSLCPDLLTRFSDRHQEAVYTEWYRANNIRRQKLAWLHATTV